MTEYQLTPPGPSLRDPGYQDLCTFFATFPDGQAWQPQFGDWIVVPPSNRPLLVLAVDRETERLEVTGGSGEPATDLPRAGCVWLPTLDQLRNMIREHFGTSGFFSSTFNNATYWYTGQMLGMTITNMQPLAEGNSPEEAALKALLMRHQW
jgi:hypothetical protein